MKPDAIGPTAGDRQRRHRDGLRGPRGQPVYPPTRCSAVACADAFRCFGCWQAATGFVTLVGFTCFYCLPGESQAKRFQRLTSPRHDRKRLLLAQCDNALPILSGPSENEGSHELLGASWLVKKCDGDVREAAYRLLPYLSAGLLIFLIVVFIYSLIEQLEVMDMWTERPYLFIFPVIGAMAAILLAFSIQYRWDEMPFLAVTVIFLCAFGTLALSFWPYMILFVLTIEEAAAPQSSRAFMFWGEGLFVFPLMLFYTSISYSIFRGKVRSLPETY
jgi:Cytochrome bd terminal oxidase subunit II